MHTARPEWALDRLNLLTDLAASLSSERSLDRLFERIVETGMRLTNADGATIYVVDGEQVTWECVRNTSLGLCWGGTSGQPVTTPPIPLFAPDGAPLHDTVVATVVHTGQAQVLDDVYADQQRDSRGTSGADARLAYRTRSLVTLPLKDHHDEVVAALQLVNARGEDGALGVPFAVESVRLAQALASMGAVAISNLRLMHLLAQSASAVAALSEALADDLTILR